MSLGVDEAARALDLAVEHVFAADTETEYLSAYGRNFAPIYAESRPIEEILDSPLRSRLSASERALKRKIGDLDLLVGGPPCQGHSDLNNHTRRQDPKNRLYERMARAAEVLGPRHIIIENVPGVRHDKARVFDRTVSVLLQLGYRVDAHKIGAHILGVPQRRNRAVLVASSKSAVGDGFLRRVVKEFAQAERSVAWAIGDLCDMVSNNPLDQITQVSEESQRRIDWMFENDVFDLPNRMRPDCHKTKSHTYKSVYGRLFWDRPSWTITTGFQVMGQGRFLHPTRRRVITSHEAARLQFFPDYFNFGASNRKGYAKMIGNAVPAKVAYVLGIELLR
jgi:DNA (cytosine-5)-methyltransferase 1